MPKFNVGDRVKITHRRVTREWPTFTTYMLADATSGIVFNILEVNPDIYFDRSRPTHYTLRGSTVCEWTVREEWIALVKRAKKMNPKLKRRY